MNGCFFFKPYSENKRPRFRVDICPCILSDGEKCRNMSQIHLSKFKYLKHFISKAGQCFHNTDHWTICSSFSTYNHQYSGLSLISFHQKYCIRLIICMSNLLKTTQFWNDSIIKMKWESYTVITIKSGSQHDPSMALTLASLIHT